MIAEHGRIDALFNNAGLGAGHARSTSPSRTGTMMAVNLRGLFFMSQAVGAA